ncbi:unnamed protein product [Urochloa decumbens]|uniref:Uncharacterized protein n=1 Tax=Urochloa decumbens TaxID=240449 RepID=A0ABC9H243_9POAL
MAASPEFYKPAAPPAAFSSPCASVLPPSVSVPVPVPEEEEEEHASSSYYYYSCRTPTGSGISYLKEPTTCPPAPRKPLCKKRLFQSQAQPVISLRLHELERIFRPHQQPKADKRHKKEQQQQQQLGLN